MKNLVIVESPAKAKTIQNYLGKDFEVKSSVGHIRDLPKKELAIDKDKNFEPKYEIPPDKRKVVSDLKKATKKTDTIWLATDEDREGEAIAWHLAQALSLDENKVKRIVFHEITEPAIKEAIKNPRQINLDLVNAQQARRILDRLVGYEVSPILWRKIQRNLSAGRVQSVTIKLIVEREREINAYKPESSFKISAVFSSGDSTIDAIYETVVKDEEEAKQLLDEIRAENKWQVAQIIKSKGKRNPQPPFTTSTLQQEANRRLGYSVKQTMSLAQRLYEAGKITYMRTDSQTLSKQAINAISSYVKKNFGEKYLKVRQYKTKSSNAQEAHEAIRPTNIDIEIASQDPREQKLYELIRSRTMASQMAPALIDKTAVTIVSQSGHKFKASGETIVFEGYMAAYSSKFKEKHLPSLNEGQQLNLQAAIAEQTYSKLPARYTEASLVKKLEQLGIGRPSTYAPTIANVLQRKYVYKDIPPPLYKQAKKFILKNGEIKEEVEQINLSTNSKRLLPSDVAMVVVDFLDKHFKQIMDYNFTATVEKELDNIAAGEKEWQEVIKSFYSELAKQIGNAESVSRKEAIQARLLGTDPKTKKPVYARIGKFGPMIQLGEADPDSDEDKPLFASMPEGKTIETVTLEDALPYFELPRILGKDKEGNEIIANIGRFGPYVGIAKKRLFVSVPKDIDIHSITLEQALELIAEKSKQQKSNQLKEFENGKIKVINGRYGPYVTDGKTNAKLPKDIDPNEITLEQAKAILETKLNKK